MNRINVFFSMLSPFWKRLELHYSEKNCLTDFYRSDIRALRGIDFLLFGLLLELTNYINSK